jgi:hypothetical protein
MDRRTLILSGLMSLGATGLARAETPTGPANADPATGSPATADPATSDLSPAEGPPPPKPAITPQPSYPAAQPNEAYSRDEIVNKVSDFLGVTAESAGGMVERLFAQNGKPTGYIAGEEGSGAFAVGLRYGRGLLYMRDKPPIEVFWQGPSVGWDFGGNASRVFTLCYNLHVADAIYQRFPGVEGTAYFVGGLGVNYQRANDITLAPIRAGVGFRLGANAGYLAYTRQRNILPF